MESFTGLLGGGGGTMTYIVCIWAIVAWIVWKSRNNKTFKGKDLEEERIIEEA